MVTVQNMFERFDNLGSEGNPLSHPRTALKIKHALEKVGIKKAIYDHTITPDTIYEDLTILVCISGGSTVSYGTYYPTTTVINALDDMRGYRSYSPTWKYPNIEDRVKLMMKIGGEEVEVGCWLKDRNIVMIYHIFTYSHMDLGNKNDFLYFFLDNIVKLIKKHKIKKVDISKFMEKKMIEKFCIDAKKKLRDNENSTRIKKDEITNYESIIVSNFKQITINEELEVTLKKMVKDMPKELKKQLRDIKTLAFVKSIDLTMRGLEVDVGKISIKYKKKDIYIGDFTILITPKAVKFNNRKRMKTKGNQHAKGLIHPHIAYRSEDFGGGVCFGNRRTEVHKLLGNNEFKKLVYFCYLYLKGYNDGDKHHQIEYWDVVNKKGVSVFNTSEGEEIMAERRGNRTTSTETTTNANRFTYRAMGNAVEEIN